MVIDSIKLTQFRNFKTLTLQLPPAGAVLVGKNGQGKTNLLEAVYLLSMGHSHRTRRDENLILWDSEYFYARADGRKKTGTFKNELYADENGKKVKVNGRQVLRVSDLMGSFNTVLFSPEDLMMVKGASSQRRGYMNKTLTQTDAVYKKRLLNYHNILKRRNHLLKNPDRDEGDVILGLLTEQLLTEAAFLIEKRREFTEKISVTAAEYYKRLSGGREDLSIRYLPQTGDMEALREKLTCRFEEEKKRGMTLWGPHRDDMAVLLTGRDIRLFGSQGQQRSAVLSLKLAEIFYIKTIVGDSPVLLLDDVLSELDEERRRILMESLSGVQTLITTTHLGPAERELLLNRRHLSLMEVREGTVRTVGLKGEQV